MRTLLVLLLLALPAAAQGAADPSKDAFEMGSPPALPDGMTEEDMWPAATAEGWKRPVLVRWQRRFEDALAVARRENRPVMVCVNMDGEIASEHFAGVRYRDPETAQALNRYACVIASVYRHTPRDYDPEGRRVECPRFETVTCGEHIQAERELYDRYFDGRRISPRHIVLDLEAKETLDVFYSWNTQAVARTFVKGVEGWTEPAEPLEETLLDLVQSPDIDAREQLESIFAEGERETRVEILTYLTEQRVVDQVEVLRSALFGLDLDLALRARRALAQCESDGALDLMAEVLKAPLEESERQGVLAAVERLAPESKRARALAALHSGLSRDSAHFEPADDAADAVREYQASAEHVSALEQAASAAGPDASLALAEALLETASDANDARFAELLAQDARAAAREARDAGAEGPRLDAVLALCASILDDAERAWTLALAAVEGGRLKAEGAEEALGGASRARLLLLFAEARQRAIRHAYRRGVEWPAEWLSDVNAAYTEVADHALVSDRSLCGYHDFLHWIGATPRAKSVLDGALTRFPDSPELHARLRNQLLWEGGPEGLARGYAERIAAAPEGETQIAWFAGYAALVEAEQYRREAQDAQALGAYARGIAHFERSAARFRASADSCEHFIALALAGRARLYLERGELEQATQALLASLARRAEAAGTADGMNLTPIQTGKMLVARLEAADDAGGAERVQAALDGLDPELLEPPASERMGSGRNRGR